MIKPQKEGSKDFEIVYLYVKHFVYKNQEDKDEMGEHPTVGRIYRAFKYDGCYELHIGEENTPSGIAGLGITKLKSYNSNWECELVELTIDNYTTLDINKLDEAKMKAWEKDNHKKLIELRTRGVSKAHTEDYNFESAFRDFIEDNTVSVTNDIKEDWSEFRGAVIEVLNYIETTFNDKYNKADINTKGLIESKDYGKGFNCGNALKYLSRYCTENFEKSNNKKDLYKAIHYLLFELTRRNIHEQK